MDELAQKHVRHQRSGTSCHCRPFGTPVYTTRILSSLIFVLQRLVYFDTTRTGGHLTLDDARLFPALGNAMEGTLSVRHSENIVERLARVSFLSFPARIRSL